MTGNHGFGSGEGPNVVEFADGQKIEYSHPGCKISGFIFGVRSMEICGEYEVTDKKNDLYFKAEFGKAGGDYRGRMDAIEGNIVKYTNPSVVLGRIHGKWTSKIMIDERVYYD